MEIAINAGAEDVRLDEDVFEVYSAPQDFPAVCDALRAAKLAIPYAEVTMIPQTTVPLEGKDAQAMVRLMEALEDHDDVQHVWANFDISRETLESLSQNG